MGKTLEQNLEETEEGKAFSNYVRKLREKRNISLETLCEGICTHQEISFLEKDVRVLDSRLQNAILERLGVGAENFEQYVDYKTYDRWAAKQRILHCICYEQWESALRLVEEYRDTYEGGNRFERQFILSMQGQIRRGLGADAEELREIYAKAVRLTIPGAEKYPLRDRTLSLKELNLLLELEQCRKDGQRQEKYIEILQYLEKHFDKVGVAKLYSKIVYLLCSCNETLTPKELLGYCDKAIEYLRNTSRLCYMWEILVWRDELLKKRIQRLGKGTSKKRSEMEEVRRENRAWLDALEKVYDRFHFRKDTYEYCYLYVEMGVYCINDVIRIRREMLGKSREKLCEEFCEVKTLIAIEERRRVPQRKSWTEFFKCLDLPVEYKKTSLITDKQEVKRLMENLVKDINNLSLEEAQEKIIQIRQQISLENRYNMQTLMKEEAYVLWNQKVIDREEYCKRMQEALQLTVEFERVLQEGEKYLTHMEQTCIQNLMQGMEQGSEELMTCVRRFQEYYRPYEEEHKLQAVWGMYGFIMGLVASELGNVGEFEESDKYNQKIIEGCLHYRKLRVLPSALYGHLWNQMKRKEQGIPVKEQLDEVQELDLIIALSVFDKQEERANLYREKRKEILKKRG